MQPVHATGRDQSPRGSISLIVARERAADGEKCSVMILNLVRARAPHILLKREPVPPSVLRPSRHSTACRETTRGTFWDTYDHLDSIRAARSARAQRTCLSAPIECQPTKNRPPRQIWWVCETYRACHSWMTVGRAGSEPRSPGYRWAGSTPGLRRVRRVRHRPLRVAQPKSG